MKRIIIIILLMIIASSFVVAQTDLKKPIPAYIISLALYDDESITLKGIQLSTSHLGRDFLTGEYTLRLVSSKGETLYIDRFDFEGIAPPPEWFDKYGKQVYVPRKAAKHVLGVQAAKEVNKITLVVPYFKDAKDMLIYNQEGKLILNVDLGLFCGEGCSAKSLPAKNPSGSKLLGFFMKIFR